MILELLWMHIRKRHVDREPLLELARTLMAKR
jgi:hypothetical protein